MKSTDSATRAETGGICFRAASEAKLKREIAHLRDRLACLNLPGASVGGSGSAVSGSFAGIRVDHSIAREWALGTDTTGLCEKLGFDPVNKADDLEREILLAMLLSPVVFEFGSYDELASAIRVRRNIVVAARATTLAFDTTRAAERPAEYWTYHEGRGFTLLPGRPLIDALRRATQPRISGQLYAFSCYRATEYVILLGLAEELLTCNPPLLDRLQRQWETRAIISGKFHEVFLHEYGSMDAPLPPRYYVPGDRLWFRNPDDASSDVTGYEGSWVFYLGGGLFTNFWQSNRPYTLTSKCLEIYHWRHGIRRDNPSANSWIDEEIVESRVQASLADSRETREILDRMMRLRDPQGVYRDGGCIDTSREYPRRICPGTLGLALPDA
ncbi:MAG: hypothetical protein Q8L56_14920 [Rhodocyclaceae bacterium]|nr:hypothetical protein [Rhodocyclaceae bacterium]